MIYAGIPAPPFDGLDLFGPFRLTMYGLCIGLGVVAAVLLASKLWRSRGGRTENVVDAMIWAVLLGIIGGRAYHVITSPDAYFGPDGDLSRIPQVWLGGLGIIGAVALGAVGVWFACRRYGMKFPAFADAVVPGVLLAQAIGRWGNYFNQELYGRRTELPWGLNVDQEHRVPQVSHFPEEALFHPTFLYESIWNVLGVVVLLVLYRRFQFKQGLIAWTYLAYYSLGRFWIESLRIDELDKSTQYPLLELTGLEWRLNMWISVALFALAVAMLLVLWRRRPQTEEELAEELEVFRPGHGPRAEEAAAEETAAEDAEGDAEADSEQADEDEDDAEEAADLEESDKDSEAESEKGSKTTS